MPQSKSQSTTTVEDSKVLNGAQKAELQDTQKANAVKKDETIELRPLEGDPIQVPVVRKAKTFIEVKVQRDGDEHPKVERYHFHGEAFIHEVNLDRVVAENADARTITEAPSDRVRKQDGGAHLTLLRVPPKNAWKDIDANDTVEGWTAYSGRMDELIELANAGKALAAKAIEQRQVAAKK